MSFRLFGRAAHDAGVDFPFVPAWARSLNMPSFSTPRLDLGPGYANPWRMDENQPRDETASEPTIGAAALGVLATSPELWKAWLALGPTERQRLAKEAGEAARKTLAALGAPPTT